MREFQILEFKRKLKSRKDRLNNNLNYLSELIPIEGLKYLKQFDGIGKEMTEKLTELEKVKEELNDLDKRLDKINLKVISDNNIDFKEVLKEHKNREEILDTLYRRNFMNSVVWERLKEDYWNERKTVSYELPKWK